MIRLFRGKFIFLIIFKLFDFLINFSQDDYLDANTSNGIMKKHVLAIKNYKNKNIFNTSFLKEKYYQKTIKKSIKLKGIGIHSNNQIVVSIKPTYSATGRVFKNSDERIKINTINENISIVQKNLHKTIKKDYNTPIYTIHELKSFFKISNTGFQPNLDNYKNEIYKKNFKIFQDVNRALDFQPNNLDKYVCAQIENILSKPTYYIILEDRKNKIKAVEHLLSALEALSIDNVVIELHGGSEIPILDGSALVWINEILKVGISTSPEVNEHNYIFTKKRRKIRFYSEKFFSIYHNDSFISYYPSNSSKITVGLDFTETAPLIGKQWFSYDLFNDNHYRWEISPSRMYIPTIENFRESIESGYFKGGIDNCVNLCMFDQWHNNEQIRFYDTECARHEILDLIGCLSLLSNNGNGGFPLGHIISYKPSLELNIRFVKLLKEMMII
uniref:UDP-3-O-acyl-N-acetylglucosamine deacetylase n=1 Tax=Lotharella vacuolata TaxID=74820 RepID=A0A0H5BL51_9EUKA|nr:hypothetical protein [Lotharella vacuolata]